MRIIDIYLQKERYNPRVRATIPGAWVVVTDKDNEIAVAPGHESLEKALANSEKMGFVFGGRLLNTSTGG